MPVSTRAMTAEMEGALKELKDMMIKHYEKMKRLQEEFICSQKNMIKAMKEDRKEINCVREDVTNNVCRQISTMNDDRRQLEEQDNKIDQQVSTILTNMKTEVDTKFEPEAEVTANPPASRKFSKENLEVIEKEDREDPDLSPKTTLSVSVTSPMRFEKNDGKNGVCKWSIPESLVKDKPLCKNKSASLELLKSDSNECDSLSQDSLKEKSKDTAGEPVMLRQKSVANKKSKDELELMKVFVRCSLKDSDVESIQQSLTEKAKDNDHQTNWDCCISLFLLAYRAVVHESTGKTPASIVFGRKPCSPADLRFGHPELPDTVENDWSKLAVRLDAIHEEVRKKIKLECDCTKTRYVISGNSAGFQEGVRVWLYHPARKKDRFPKLAKAWEGSHNIVKRINDVVERIPKSPRAKMKVVHRDQLAAPYRRPVEEE